MWRNLYRLFCEICQRFNILLSVEKKYGKVILEQMFIDRIKNRSENVGTKTDLLILIKIVIVYHNLTYFSNYIAKIDTNSIMKEKALGAWRIWNLEI